MTGISITSQSAGAFSAATRSLLGAGMLASAGALGSIGSVPGMSMTILAGMFGPANGEVPAGAAMTATAGAFSIAAPLFLDANTGATWGVSLKQLTTGYSGAAINVRRASDSATQDISFNSNGDADPVAFAAFMGASTCFLTRWYDQSGNGNDAVQATTTKQPQVIVDTDGLLSIVASTTSSMTVATATVFKTAVQHLFAVANPGNNDNRTPTSNGGTWINYGPASGVYWSHAYWGFGIAPNSQDSPFASLQMPRNGTSTNGTQSMFQNAIGEGVCWKWSVWDYDSFGQQTNIDGVSWGSPGSNTANITYSTSTSMLLFASQTATYQPSGQKFRQMVLFPSVQSARVTMAQSEVARWGTTPLPTTFTDSNGFVYDVNNIPNNPLDGGADDGLGMAWLTEAGTYAWPSIANANNINNGATLFRCEVHVGDSDQIDNQENRAEQVGYLASGGSAYVGPFATGTTVERFFQFKLVQWSAQTAGWRYLFQNHYASGPAPDIFTIGALGGNFTFETQHGAGPTDVTHYTTAYTTGVVYACRIIVTWGATTGHDRLQIYFGTNGSTLTLVYDSGVNATLWDNDPSGAYPKRGIYRGEGQGGSQTVGTDILEIYNDQCSATTNAFAAYVTTQPALPTHP